MATPFFESWEKLKSQAPFDRVSMFLNGRRRYLVDWMFTYNRSPKKTKSLIFALREYLRYLITLIPASTDQTPVAVIYGLKTPNYTGMIEKVVEKLRPQVKVARLDSIRPYAFNKGYLEILGPNFWSRFSLSLRHYLAAVRDIIETPAIFRDIGLIRVMLSLLPQSAVLVFYQEYLRKKGVRVLQVPDDAVEFTELWCAAAVLEKIPVMVMQHGVLSSILLPTFATKFFLWGRYSYNTAKRLGFNPDTLEISGTACFNPPKQVNTPAPRGGKLRFLFFSAAHLPDLSGPKSCQEARDWLFDVAKRLPKWELVIRLHPAELQDKFYDIPNRPANITIEYAKSVKIEDSIAMSNACGTIWSGAGLDCMLMQKPLVQFLGRDWPERISWYRLGILRVGSSDELASILDRLTQDEDYQKEVLAVQSNVITETFSNFHGEEVVAQKIREYIRDEAVGQVVG